MVTHARARNSADVTVVCVSIVTPNESITIVLYYGGSGSGSGSLKSLYNFAASSFARTQAAC